MQRTFVEIIRQHRAGLSITLIIWLAFVLFTVFTPSNPQRIVSIGPDDNLSRPFYPKETWTDGTIFRWNSHLVSHALPRVRYQYFFVSVAGMAYADDTPFVAQLTYANPQRITFDGVSSSFRVHRFVFLPNSHRWSAQDDFRLSLSSPPDVVIPVVNDRALMLALSYIDVLPIPSHFLPLITESSILIAWLLLLLLFAYYTQRSSSFNLLFICSVALHVWAYVAFWPFEWHALYLVVLTLIVLPLRSYYQALRNLIRRIQFTWMNPLLLKPINPLLVLAILSLVWVAFSSYHMLIRWDWDYTDVLPTPLILAGFIAWPLLTCILYYLWHVRVFHKSTLAIFFVYLSLATIIFFQLTPGCFPPDGLANFNAVKSGSWSAWNSVLQHPILTAFMQLIPWDYHAPLIFLLLLWTIVLTFAHAILIKQQSHWVFHLGIFAITLTPAFVVSITNIVRDTYFTALVIGFLLFAYHTFKFHTYTSRRTIVAVSLLGAFIALYRSDSAPLVGGVFLLLWITVLRPSWLSMVTPTTQPHVRTVSIRQSAIIFVLPILLLFGYAQLIPASLLPNQYVFKGNSWTNNSQEAYQLTLIENPLSYILLQPDAVIRPEYLPAIERIYQIDDLKRQYCPFDICLFWSGTWNKKSTVDERNALVRTSINIFADNPLLFIRSRLATLNTVGGPNHFVQCNLVIRGKAGMPTLYQDVQILPLGQQLVEYYKSTLVKAQLPTIYFVGKSVWYNVLVFILISIPMLIWYRVEPILSLLMLFLLLRTLMVIILAPAGLLTYYLALYIGVLVLYVFWLAALVAHRKHTRLT
ncbi:MAG: hypothetical protein ACO3F2_07985 [Roseiflexaceae bacterium]